MWSASSDCVGARPSSLARALVAWFSDLLKATAERGKYDSWRTSSKMAPRTRLKAKLSNSMPLVGL